LYFFSGTPGFNRPGDAIGPANRQARWVPPMINLSRIPGPGDSNSGMIPMATVGLVLDVNFEPEARRYTEIRA
jgi:hypothetical protein